MCIWVRTRARNGCYVLWERLAEGDSPQLGLSDPGTLQAVSPRIAERKWNTLYPRSPAGQLWQGCPSITEYQHLSSPPFSLFFSPPLFLLLAAVCLCVLCKKRAEKKNREESGGRVASSYNRLPGDSKEHKEFPEAFIPRFIVWIYFCTYTEVLFAITQQNVWLYVLLNAPWILSILLDIAAVLAADYHPFKWIAYI